MIDIVEQWLFKCYETLGFDFSNYKDSSEKETRIVFQKYGLFFDYFFNLKVGKFSLYINGPYNSDLASVGYKIADDIELFKNETNELNLSDDIISFISELHKKLGTEPDKLEIIATYFYLNKYKGLTDRELKLTLESIKGHLMTAHDFKYNDVVSWSQEIESLEQSA